MIKDYLAYVLGNLRHRKLRSWLTMIGIFIGIAAVVSLIGLGEGLRTAIMGQFGFLGSDVISVQAAGLAFGPPGTGTVKPLTRDLTDKIENINGVESAIYRYIESGTLEFNDVQGIGMAASMPSGEDRKIIERTVNLKVDQGRLLRDGDGKKVILGNDFSTEDNGFGRPIVSGDKVLINGESFEVVGILEKKGSFIFDSALMINEDVLLDLVGSDGEDVDIIAVKVKDTNRVEEIQKDIEKILRKERDVKEGEEDFVVQTPQAILEDLNSTLFAVQLFIYIIAGISLAVGGIGIMNTMFTSVLERTKEIGIMKAIGARNSMIFSLFFIESGFLGMVGGIIGIILGLIIAYGMAFIGKLVLGSDLIQATIGLPLISGALTFSFVVGTAFGVLPALQASRMQPVESLRKAK